MLTCSYDWIQPTGSEEEAKTHPSQLFRSLGRIYGQIAGQDGG